MRFLFVDGLRGLAATMVMIYHFTVAGPDSSHPFIRAFPSFLVSVLRSGSLGVEIFFVISGFVIAYSQRGSRVTPGYFLNFALRRSLRLDPPYWFVILLETGILLILSHTAGGLYHKVPGPGWLAAHVFYMQDFLHYGNIVPVCWTLCMEVQFYLFFTLVRGLSQWVGPITWQMRSEGITMTLVGIVSVGIYNTGLPEILPGLFVKFWFMFFLGVTVWWAVSDKQRKWYFFGLLAMVCGAELMRFDLANLFALVTAVTIFTAAKTGKMSVWLSGGVFQYLGRISYSLYLIHVVVGTRVVLFGIRYAAPTMVIQLIWVFIGALSSIGAAALMNRWIEQPSMRLAKRLGKSALKLGGKESPARAV